MLNETLKATLETLYMVFVSGALTVMLGGPLGIFLFISKTPGFYPMRTLYQSLSFIVNVGRSVPFIILMLAIMPMTRWLVGTSIGTTAAMVALTVAAIPFLARLFENVLSDLSKGLIEAGFAMGARPMQMLRHILLPEAMPGLINATTLTLVNLVAYSAMAGTVGGGGLGTLAINYGRQRFDPVVMVSTVVILVLIVQALQFLGDKINHRFSKRKGEV